MRVRRVWVGALGIVCAALVAHAEVLNPPPRDVINQSRTLIDAEVAAILQATQGGPPPGTLTDEATGMPAPLWAMYFPKRDGQVHVSGGAGFAAAQRWQVDFAVDHARTVTTYSLSTIIRF